ncbi:MAG TPA: hypothetical protein HPP56_03545 [Nitrospirae bacterium]|nr:hypothetical protein [Nitrospirota bacterium]
MSTYIDLGKEPKDLEERQTLIKSHIIQIEEKETLGSNIIQQRVFDLLVCEKGYPKEVISANKAFKISLPDTSFDAFSDLSVTINGIIAIIIKCAINSIESWERYSFAFARTAEETYQIPFAIVTDSEKYIVLDVLAGNIFGRGVDNIPTYEFIKRFIENYKLEPYRGDKREREKRILHAFSGLRCSPDSC